MSDVLRRSYRVDKHVGHCWIVGITSVINHVIGILDLCLRPELGMLLVEEEEEGAVNVLKLAVNQNELVNIRVHLHATVRRNAPR